MKRVMQIVVTIVTIDIDDEGNPGALQTTPQGAIVANGQEWASDAWVDRIREAVNALITEPEPATP